MENKIFLTTRDYLIYHGVITRAPCECKEFGSIVPYEWDVTLEAWLCPLCNKGHYRKEANVDELLPNIQKTKGNI